MAVKTITITESAYEALKAKKEDYDSFSETILRITKKRPLSDFFGVLRKESADRLEKAIMEGRKRRRYHDMKRAKMIAEAFRG